MLDYPGTKLKNIVILKINKLINQVSYDAAYSGYQWQINPLTCFRWCQWSLRASLFSLRIALTCTAPPFLRRSSRACITIAIVHPNPSKFPKLQHVFDDVPVLTNKSSMCVPAPVATDVAVSKLVIDVAAQISHRCVFTCSVQLVLDICYLLVA